MTDAEENCQMVADLSSQGKGGGATAASSAGRRATLVKRELKKVSICLTGLK